MTDLQATADSRLVEQTIFTVIPIVFALLHLLLYSFSRQRRDHLYFAILTGGFALAAHYDFLLDQGGTPDYVISLQR